MRVQCHFCAVLLVCVHTLFYNSPEPLLSLPAFWIQRRSHSLTLTPLTWTIWRAPTNASKWRTGFNSAFKGLMWSLRKWQLFIFKHDLRLVDYEFSSHTSVSKWLMVLKKKNMLKQFHSFHRNTSVMTIYNVTHLVFQNKIRFLSNLLIVDTH